QVIDEVQSSPKPIVLFIDEVQTLVGAGGAAGTGDAANLLKPALARGTLRTIGATTWAEYKKYIEKDPALTRRFQTVKIDEPDEDKAVLMMRGIVSTMEKHHRIQILDEALEAAVKLAHRYIPDRQLPDKSVSLLDTACARVAVSHHATPAEVEDSQRRIEALKTELEIIGREAAIGIDTAERETAVTGALQVENERLATLQAAWKQEKTLVDEILELRGKLREATGKADVPAGGVTGKPDAASGVGKPTGADGGGKRDAAGTAAPAATPAGAPAATAGATPEGAQSGGKPLSEAERKQAIARLQELQQQLSKAQGERPLVLPSVDEQAVASVVADWTGIPVGRMVKDEITTVLKLAET